MFKHHINILPPFLNNLLTPNNTHHNHYTKQNNDLPVNIGQRENLYRSFSLHGILIWNHLKNNYLDVSYACYKTYLKTTYRKIT